MTKGQEDSFGGGRNGLQLDCDDGHTICNLLEVTELQTQNRWIPWSVNHASIKLLNIHIYENTQELF